MKSNIKQLFLLILAFGQTPFAWAMDVPSLKRADYQIRFSPKDSPLENLIDAINETPQGGLIAMNGSFINHPRVVEGLKHAQNRGVRLELCVDARKSENKILLQELAHGGLSATNSLHTKRCIIYDIDPADDLEVALRARSAKVFTGSENLSNNAGNHHEYTFISRQPELVKRHYKDHLFTKALCARYKMEESAEKEFHRAKVASESKKSAPLSPRFTRIYNSQKYDSGKLKEARIAKPVPADAKEQMYISSMGFDDERVAYALRDKVCAGTDITLVVDKAAVKSAHGLRLLNELHSVGVKIFVWEKSSIQHTKLLLRERRNKIDDHYLDSLAVLSTGNLVKNSSTEINYDQVVPESHAVSQDIRAYFDTLIPICTPFANIDQQAIAQKKASKGKELFSVACGTCNEQIGASAQKTVIKSLLQHCIQVHAGYISSTRAVKDITPARLFCSTCPECREPFYTQASAVKTTYNVGLHLVKDHSETKATAAKIRKDLPVAAIDVHIVSAEQKENKKV